MAPPHRIDAQDSVLVIIDVQASLWAHVEPQSALTRFVQLADAAEALDVPVLVTEQSPAKLGTTVSTLREALGSRYRPFAKTAFAAFDDDAFLDAFRATRRHTAILCGIESHICVLQTALTGLTRGYDVHVARDAIACHGTTNADAALAEFTRLGVGTPSTEQAIYQWLRDASSAAFRQLLPQLKASRAEPTPDATEPETR